MASWLSDRRKLTVLSLIVAFVFLGALNAFSNSVLRGLSIDLTEDDVYTLSPGTQKVLRNLEEPITLRFFLSPALTDRVPSYAVYARRVRALLERYARLSNGKIKLEFYEPTPFSIDEDRAETYGLAGVTVDTSGQKGFFGVAGTNSVDDVEKIAFFHPSRERFIEYDLTRMILTLGQTKKKTVGLISSLPLQGRFSMRGMLPPWGIMNEIDGVFSVKSVGNAKTIPDDVDVLFIVHPRGLKRETLYAIDQYVLKGGTAVVMVDPIPEAAPRRRGFMGISPVSPGSSMPKLFKAWGIEMVPGKVATDVSLALQVVTEYQGRRVRAPFIAWMNLPRAQIDGKDPTTQNVRNLIIASPGILRKTVKGTSRVVPLVWTTEKSMAVDAQKLRLRPDVVALYQAYKPGGRKLVLAARVTGKVKTAFPGGIKTAAKKPAPKKDPAKKDEAKKDKANAKKAAHLEEAKGSINLIVVADVDMLEEKFWSRTSNFFGAKITLPTSGNANFLVNALDQLSGANLLIGLRGKGEARRPFTKVQKLERDARREWQAKEAAIVKALQEARKKLASARSKSKDGKNELTEEQRKVIAQVRADIIRLRRERNDIRVAQRRDIETLDRTLKFANIGAIPVIIGLIALIVSIVRVRRRRRRYQTG